MRKEDELQKWQKVMHRFLRFWRLHGQILDRITAKQGLYKSQMKMLGDIRHHEGISQRELAKIMEISPPSIAVTAKKLEKRGYIVRQVDEKDNRLNVLNTTPEGRAILDATWREFSGVDARMFEGFSDEECAQIVDFYDRIIKNLEKIDRTVDDKKDMRP